MTEESASRPRKMRSSLSVRDLINEAAAAITRRPGRSLLTALGTVVGVGAFVATTGLASTAKAQVSERFDALAATEVRVTLFHPEMVPDERLSELVDAYKESARTADVVVYSGHAGTAAR